MALMPLTFSSGLGAVILNNIGLVEGFGTSQWIAVFTITIFTMAFALTPTTIIAIISGYFLGFSAIIPLVVSYSLASIIGFILSKPLGSNFQSLIRNSYPKLDSFIHRMSDKSPIRFVIFSRISPVLPFAVMNLVLPFVGIKFKPFFWGGIVGMLPRTILAIAVGKLAKDIYSLVEHPGSTTAMQLGFGVLLIISVLGFVFMYRRK
jgi:uncharacterized membrane protein YdjX (TVP38/TMEM64 family)